jgi:hypothetical protein
MTDERVTPDLTNPVYNWPNRTRIAWLMALGVTVQLFYALITPEISESQLELLTTVAWVQGATIGAFMGFKMTEMVFGKRRG